MKSVTTRIFLDTYYISSLALYITLICMYGYKKHYILAPKFEHIMKSASICTGKIHKWHVAALRKAGAAYQKMLSPMYKEKRNSAYYK